MRPHLLLSAVLPAMTLVAVCFAQERTEAPNRKSAAAPRNKQPAVSLPSQYDEGHVRKAPSLAVSPEEAREAVQKFIAWAGASTVRQREEARAVISEARENKAVASALCDEVLRAQKTNHSRAILVLSILGEMRSSVGEECLRKLLHQPFPEKGTIAHGEIVEQTALGTLQAKAVDGLAYLHTSSGDEEVLWAAGKHPSRIVRAEAIEAYLWNHKDSEQARAVLMQHVRPEEKVFLDRIRRDPTENAEVFNRKLEAFLKAHPDLVPSPPQRLPQRKGSPGREQPPVR